MPVSHSDLLFEDYLSAAPGSREEMVSILDAFAASGIEFSLTGSRHNLYIGIPNDSNEQIIDLAHKAAAAKPLTDMIRNWLLMQRFVQRVRAEDAEAATERSA